MPVTPGSKPSGLLATVGSLWFGAVLLVLLSAAMACATVFESQQSTEQALTTFYRAWWFRALLGLLARLGGWSVLITATAFGGFEFSPPGQGNGPWLWFACPPLPMLLLGLLVTVVLIPPGEEIINRGLIFGQIARRNRSRAVITSAALFAILHNPEGMAAAFAIGILLAIQTFQTGSILPSIVTHATYNFLRVVDWYCMHAVWNPEIRTNTSTAVGAGSMVVGALAFGVAIWISVRSGSERITRPDPNQ